MTDSADRFAEACAAASSVPEYDDLAMFGLADATPEEQERMVERAHAAYDRLVRRTQTMRDEQGQVVRCMGPGCQNAAVGYGEGSPKCEACMPRQVVADSQGRVPSPRRPYVPEEEN